jgi:hypothetical protein
MLDPETGALRFDEPKVTLGADLTLTSFLQSTLAKTIGDKLVGGEGYQTFWFKQHHASGGLTLAVGLCFQNERLENVELQNDDPAFGTSWDDWSEAKELSRKQSHDRWLNKCVGGRRNFPWGEVWSGYDERGGSSSIVIRYRDR